MSRLTNITVRTKNNTTHTVRGYEIGDFLLVHRTLQFTADAPPVPTATGKGWVVAHKGTGLYLGAGIPLKKTAISAARRIINEATKDPQAALSSDESKAAAAFDATLVRAIVASAERGGT